MFIQGRRKISRYPQLRHEEFTNDRDKRSPSDHRRSEGRIVVGEDKTDHRRNLRSHDDETGASGAQDPGAAVQRRQRWIFHRLQRLTDTRTEIDKKYFYNKIIWKSNFTKKAIFRINEIRRFRVNISRY